MIKKVIGVIVFLVFLIAAVGFYFSFKDTKDPYVQSCDYTVPKEMIPEFTEVSIDFQHSFDEEKTLPFTASAMIDIDNDGIDEIFVGGGLNQKDEMFKYSEGKFSNISGQTQLHQMKKSNTLGAVSFDLDANGFSDLILTRKDGVYLLKNLDGVFTEEKLPVTTNKKSTPLSLTLGDYDHDGDADIFLSNYIKIEEMEGQTIFNDKSYGASSILLRNDTEGSVFKFTDVTKELGMSYIHNTFQAIFTDVNNDGWLDLVVAYDTGEPRIYKNVNGERFELKETPLTGKFSYPMGIAAGDYNNDGLIDFFFSNTGSTVPEFLVKGDLTENQDLITDWILYENRGDFKFEDVAKKAKIADFEFSWGAVFEDFNLDGLQDLVVAENYIAFPANKLFKLPCRFLLQNEGGTFSAVEEQAGVVNKNFAITPLTSDFNQDGYPDLVYANLNGPLKVFISKKGVNHFVRVRFWENAANLGSRVVLKTKSGKKLTDHYLIGEGLASDQSNAVTFGLGQEEKPLSLEIYRPNGDTVSIDEPMIDVVYQIGMDK